MIAKLLLLLLLLASATLGMSDSYQPYIATAYSLHGRTASGVPVRYGLVAADKRLKFGTILHIKGIGKFVVADRGGAIGRNRIDIYMANSKDARKFGKRKVLVAVCN